MEIVAEWFTSSPEAHQTTRMLYGFIQSVAAIVKSRFMHRPGK